MKKTSTAQAYAPLFPELPLRENAVLAPGEIVVVNFAGGGGASEGIARAMGRPVNIASPLGASAPAPARSPMHTGTKSVLIGAHQFLLHPLFLAAAWHRLYGAPTDPRLWVAFVTHDLGYWGVPNMDDERGERHVEFGARLMARLFDPLHTCTAVPTPGGDLLVLGEWGRLSLLHSRFYSRRMSASPSRLCAADKLAMALQPWWLYLPRVLASGEAWEYLYEYNFGKYRTDPDGAGKDPILKVTEAEVRARRLNRRTWAALREWHTWTQGFLHRWAREHAQVAN